MYPLNYTTSQFSASLEPYKQEVTSTEINGCALEEFIPLSAGISMNDKYVEAKCMEILISSDILKFLLVNDSNRDQLE